MGWPQLNAIAVDTGRPRLQLLDTALVDSKTRNVDSALFQAIVEGAPHQIEMRGRTLTLWDVFEIGSGFEADGYMIVSDATFLRLFPSRHVGAPSHIFVDVEDGVATETVVARLRQTIEASDVQIRMLDAAADADQRFQTTERPMGLVFGFGVVIGVLVGVVIVYQVLSSDVADHLKEYATLKAIGYRDRFFLGIVFEEALVLAVIGFVPGVLISLGLYALVSDATGLPLVMDGVRPVLVLLGTVAMCLVSGAIATHRLAAADPADLF